MNIFLQRVGFLAIIFIAAYLGTYLFWYVSIGRSQKQAKKQRELDNKIWSMVQKCVAQQLKDKK
jgi:hypothetical protein